MEKCKFNKKIRAGGAFSAALAMALLLPGVTAYADYSVYPDTSENLAYVASYVASSTGLSRTAEEWALLQDDILLYDEIADLVHEYNSTVITNRSDLDNDERQFMDSKEVSDYLMEKAEEYDSDATDIEDTSATLAATYRTTANSLRREADENLDDFDIMKLEYAEIEAQTALSARNQFLTYYSSLYQQAYYADYVAYLEKAYNSTVNLYNNEMATELEVLTARETLEEAEASMVTTDNTAEENRKSLIVLCGWKYDAYPEIGDVPSMTPSEVLDVNYDADFETAMENNYTLRIDARRLKNASEYGYATLVSEQENQTKQDTDSFGISFKAAYDSMVNAVNTYNNAVTARANSAKDLEYANQQYSLGMLSAIELEGVKISDLSAELTVQTSYISMISARAAYDAAVNDGIL